MNINDLNDYCLFNIFEELPISILIKQRKVCKRWCQIIEDRFLKPKRSLKLFDKTLKKPQRNDVKPRKDIFDYCFVLECDNAFVAKEMQIHVDVKKSDELKIDKSKYGCKVCENALNKFALRIFSNLERLIICQKKVYKFVPSLIKKSTELKSFTYGRLSKILDDESFLVQKMLIEVYKLTKLEELHLLDPNVSCRLSSEGMRRIGPQLSKLSLFVDEFHSFYIETITSVNVQLPTIEKLHLSSVIQFDKYIFLWKKLSEIFPNIIELNLGQMAEYSVNDIKKHFPQLAKINNLDNSKFHYYGHLYDPKRKKTLPPLTIWKRKRH
ncbi:hypothetical protein RDWZM_002729 [Blomia tropicalis]|uniref:F-box domain-containing protein n=1 Tax=Blomia tropicalis TaxID=40697 RepID=A0A9Q0RRU6_BLOTA|nr:hypothetical protein RDWZM_002729 [Blomia tropicalis]